MVGPFVDERWIQATNQHPKVERQTVSLHWMFTVIGVLLL